MFEASRDERYCAGRWVFPIHYTENQYGFIKKVYWRNLSIAVELPYKPNIFRRFLAWIIFGMTWQDWDKYSEKNLSNAVKIV